MTEATAHARAEALLYNWVSRFGVPDDITTDRGPTSVSQLWTALAQLMGTSLHRSTAYNAAANGMAQRAHRTLKTALMARCTGHDWKSHFHGCDSDSELHLKRAWASDRQKWFTAKPLPFLSGEFFPTDLQPATNKQLAKLRRTVGNYSPCQQTCTDCSRKYVPKALQTCKYVFLRHDVRRPPLTRPYRGPYVLLDRKDEEFLVSINGRSHWVSGD